MHKLLTLSTLVLILTSCQNKPQEAEIVRPVKTITINLFKDASQSYPGVVEAENASNLTFSVTGTLKVLHADEGKTVQKGQLIAAIDVRDIQLKASAAKADYERLSAQFERYRKLLDNQAISQQDYESVAAQYENAKSAYQKAQNDLSDTRLVAPFTGYIEKKYVDNFQEVNPGQNIVRLVDPSVFQIRFTLPDRNISFLEYKPEFYISFEVDKNQEFKAKFKEIVSTSIDGAGQPVYLTIDDPKFDRKKFNVSSGYSCMVRMKFANLDVVNLHSVPLTALFKDEMTGQTCVWVVDVKSSKVKKTPIKTDRILGKDQVVVLEGLEDGATIVVAGTNRISENQVVHIQK